MTDEHASARVKSLPAERDKSAPGSNDSSAPTRGPLVGLMFEDLELGQTAEMSKQFEDADIGVFAELSGDNNPVHVDADYAATTMFKQCIAHGMLTGSLISALFGTRLPGPGAIYISQTFNFRAPVFAGDEITASVEVADLFPAKNRVKFDCACRNQSGKTVLVGEAILMVPSREKA